MRNDLDRAAALLTQGKVAEAESFCRSFLSYHPEDLPARVLLGKILQAAGRHDAAQTAFHDVVLADPTYTEGWLGWVNLLRMLGHAAAAEERLRYALKQIPGSHALHNDLALLLLSQDKLEDAEAHLHQALTIESRSVISLCNLGLVQGRRGNFAAAAAAFRSAIAIDPDLPEAHNGLGDALKVSDRDAAVSSFREALRLRPNYAEALDNLGVIAFIQGRLTEAFGLFQRAFAAAPSLTRASAHIATTLFHLGRLPEAWRAHRERFKTEGFKHDPHGRFPLPIWRGESLKDKALLVWTESGLGEEVLQAGMFDDVLGVASALTIECSPRLEGLFRRSFPKTAVIPRLNPSRASPVPVVADYQVAGGDLGAFFRDEWTKFRPHTGYLRVDAGKVAELRRGYAKGNAGMIVGIAWASSRARIGRDKTLSLMEFAPILRTPGVVFVSLQYDADPDEIDAVHGSLGVEIVADPTIDFAGDMDPVAAQIAAMDMVVSVSNTSVHLAGALNVPVWNIIPGYNSSGMWHWFSGKDTSPWYPSMRIYRREARTNEALMERIAGDLACVLNSRAAKPDQGITA